MIFFRKPKKILELTNDSPLSHFTTEYSCLAQMNFGNKWNVYKFKASMIYAQTLGSQIFLMRSETQLHIIVKLTLMSPKEQFSHSF